MENLLTEIEGSENNNPQLKAALQEISRLQSIIEEAKAIVDATMGTTQFQIDGGPLYTPTFNELNNWKVDCLSNILYND